MQTPDHDPRPAGLPAVTLLWALDSEDDPTEITIFDPRNEITTHWITIDSDYAFDLTEMV